MREQQQQTAVRDGDISWPVCVCVCVDSEAAGTRVAYAIWVTSL